MSVCELKCQACVVSENMPKLEDIGMEPFVCFLREVRDNDGAVVMTDEDAVLLSVAFPIAQARFYDMAGSLRVRDLWPSLEGAVQEKIRNYAQEPRVEQTYRPDGWYGQRGLTVVAILPIPESVVGSFGTGGRLIRELEEAAAMQFRMYQVARRIGS